MTQPTPIPASPSSAADAAAGSDLWDLRHDTTWRPHAHRMAGHLVRADVLTDGAWRQALLDVPRHHFTPTSFHLASPAAWAPRHRPDGGPHSPAGRAWLRAVYDQVEHIVALSGIDIWGRQHPVAVNPDPATTTRMLQALDIRATDRILELGTGSAHTTALLAHRVGPGRVTSVELDPELHHLATHRLAQLDLHPHLVLADSTTLDTAPLRPDPPPASGAVRGAAGGGDSMPGFDRVLVGHTVDHLPAAWLRHTRPDAIVLATLAGGLGAAHPALLRHTPDHHLTGAFLPWPTPALPHRRHHARHTTVRRPIEPAAARPRHRSTPVDPTTLHSPSPQTLLHQLHLPAGTTAAIRADADGSTATFLHAPDSSWAEISHHPDRHGRHDARIAGPTNLLTALHTARDVHHDLRQPAWTDLGLTTEPDPGTTGHGPGTVTTAVWHADPDTGPRWPVHTAPARLGATT